MAYSKKYNYSKSKPKPRYYAGVRMNRRGVRTKWNWNDLARGAALALETLNAEKKHFDSTINPTIDTSGVVVSLNRDMAQGISNNTYIGNSIRMKAIQANYQFVLNPSATTTRIKIAIVLDTRPFAAGVANYTDIYQGAGLQSFLNLDNQLNRFRVLSSKYITISSDSMPEKQVAIYRKLDHHCKFNDATVPVQNELLLCMISDEATNTPGVSIRTRLRYYDN